jgi:hypothetical protein
MSGGLWFYFWDPAAWVPAPPPPVVATMQGSIVTVDPRFMTVKNWTALTGSMLRRYGFVPQLMEDEAWRAWGETVIEIPAIAALTPPVPKRFVDWRDFAYSLNYSIANAGL